MYCSLQGYVDLLTRFYAQELHVYMGTKFFSSLSFILLIIFIGTVRICHIQGLLFFDILSTDTCINVDAQT